MNATNVLLIIQMKFLTDFESKPGVKRTFFILINKVKSLFIKKNFSHEIDRFDKTIQTDNTYILFQDADILRVNLIFQF